MPEGNDPEGEVQSRLLIEALRAEFRGLEAQLSWADEPAVVYRLEPPRSDDDR